MAVTASYNTGYGTRQGTKQGTRQGLGRVGYHKLDTVTEWANRTGYTPNKLFTLQETASPVYDTTAAHTFSTNSGSQYITYGNTTPYAGDKCLSLTANTASRLASATSNYMDSATGAGNGSMCIWVCRYNSAGNYNIFNALGGSPTNGFNFYSASTLVPRVTFYDGTTNQTVSFAVPRGDMGWGAIAFGIDRATAQIFMAYRFGNETYISKTDTSLGAITAGGVGYLGTNPSTGCAIRRMAFFSGDYATKVQEMLNRICA